MLSLMICYQIPEWRRDCSWPTGLQWLWMICEILFPYLSFSEMPCVLPMYLQGCITSTFPSPGSETVRSNATWLFLPALSWSIWLEKKDRWSWRMRNHFITVLTYFYEDQENSRHINMLKKSYKCLNSQFWFSSSLSA